MASPLHQLVDTELDAAGHATLRAEVDTRRQDNQSWKTIADWVTATTGRDVPAETLRRWFSDDNT